MFQEEGGTPGGAIIVGLMLLGHGLFDAVTSAAAGHRFSGVATLTLGLGSQGLSTGILWGLGVHIPTALAVSAGVGLVAAAGAELWRRTLPPRRRRPRWAAPLAEPADAAPCPVCLDEPRAAPPSLACASCATPFHRACVAGAPRCPSRGCGGEGEGSPSPR